MHFLELAEGGCPWPKPPFGKLSLILALCSNVEVYGKVFMGRQPVQLSMALLRRAFHLIRSCYYHFEILQF